ncbi:MAG: dihydroorotase [Fibrobacteraceae bacterium]|nr:dihydroorotase [Fibrobacteraceae bacterium]
MANVILKNVRPFLNGKFAEPTTMNLVEGVWTENYVDSRAKVIDGNGALVLPALFGLGLDFKEPLRDDIYTFDEGLEAMRRGGFYGGLYESSANPIDDASKLSAIKQLCSKSSLNLAFLGAFSNGFECEELAEMVELSEGGVVGFGDGNKNCSRNRFLRLAMEYGAMTGKRFFFLPLDSSLRHHGLVHEGAAADTLGMKGIPRIAETTAAFTILEMARFLKVPVHFKQISCGETLKLIERAREDGVDVTCDVDLYHLLIDDSCLFDLDSHCNVVMPFRAAADREALWKGLEGGVVNAISVNHEPVLRQDKEVNFEDAVPGAVSLEIALGAIWKPLRDRLGDARAVELLSSAPAKLAGVSPAELKVGASANLVMLNPDAPTKVAPSMFAGQVRNSPLLGKEVPSKIMGTYLGGLWTEV